jgi:hypothetical protein
MAPELRELPLRAGERHGRRHTGQRGSEERRECGHQWQAGPGGHAVASLHPLPVHDRCPVSSASDRLGVGGYLARRRNRPVPGLPGGDRPVRRKVEAWSSATSRRPLSRPTATCARLPVGCTGRARLRNFTHHPPRPRVCHTSPVDVVVEVAQIVLHEADEPDPLAGMGQYAQMRWPLPWLTGSGLPGW